MLDRVQLFVGAAVNDGAVYVWKLEKYSTHTFSDNDFSERNITYVFGNGRKNLICVGPVCVLSLLFIQRTFWGYFFMKKRQKKNENNDENSLVDAKYVYVVK